MNISEDNAEYNMTILREYVRICDEKAFARPVCCVCGDEAGEYDEPLCDICFEATADIAYWLRKHFPITFEDAQERAYGIVSQKLRTRGYVLNVGAVTRAARWAGRQAKAQAIEDMIRAIGADRASEQV